MRESWGRWRCSVHLCAHRFTSVPCWGLLAWLIPAAEGHSRCLLPAPHLVTRWELEVNPSGNIYVTVTGKRIKSGLLPLPFSWTTGLPAHAWLTVAIHFLKKYDLKIGLLRQFFFFKAEYIQQFQGKAAFSKS